MLKLILVRHAKSAWGDATLADFDRPLAPRGRRAAAWVGDALRERRTAPGLILCSPAARTRETLQLAALGGAVRFEPRVYEVRDGDYLDLLRAVEGSPSPLVLIGHNSATAVTAALLAGSRDDFPTAAFAIIELAIAEWRELRAGQGRLVEYCVPPKD